MISSEIQLRVLYAHTDKMGIVNNGRYFEYFEAGRNNLLREIGIPYTKLEELNYGLPVIEAHAEYLSAAKYDDVVIVKTFLKSIPTVRIKLTYEVYAGEKLVVVGHTIHSFIKLSTMKPVKPPQSFLEIVKSKIRSNA